MLSNLLTIQRPCRAGHHCCRSPAAQQCACVSVDDKYRPHSSLLHSRQLITDQQSEYIRVWK